MTIRSGGPIGCINGAGRTVIVIPTLGGLSSTPYCSPSTQWCGRFDRVSYTPPMAYGAAEKAVQPVDGSILMIDGRGRAVGRPYGRSAYAGVFVLIWGPISMVDTVGRPTSAVVGR